MKFSRWMICHDSSLGKIQIMIVATDVNIKMACGNIQAMPGQSSSWYGHPSPTSFSRSATQRKDTLASQAWGLDIGLISSSHKSSIVL
jgi:hypothetical protein